MSLSVLSQTISIVIVGAFDMQQFSIRQLRNKHIIVDDDILSFVDKAVISQDRINFQVGHIDVLIDRNRIQVRSNKSMRVKDVSDMAKNLISMIRLLEVKAVGINFDFAMCFDKYSSYKRYLDSLTPTSSLSQLTASPVNTMTIVDKEYVYGSYRIVRTISITDQTTNPNQCIVTVNVNNHKQFAQEQVDDVLLYIDIAETMQNKFNHQFSEYIKQYQ